MTKTQEQTDEEWYQEHLKDMTIDDQADHEWEIWSDESQVKWVDPTKEAYIAGYLKGVQKRITGKSTHEE